MKDFNQKITIIFSILTAALFILFPHKGICDEKTAIAEADKAVGRYIGDYTAIDQDGRKFILKELLGKPMIISFIYTGCSHICPTITTNLKNAIKEGRKDFGTKFNALTISFDWEKDTPERMKEYGSNFTDDFKSWIFATADRDTIERLTRDTGFYYKRIADGFDHMNLTTIVDKEGKIYKQIYGMDFKPQEILQPLGQLLSSQQPIRDLRPSDTIGKLLLFCYKYDEATGTYRLDYGMLITMIVGPIFFMGMMLSLIIYLFWGSEIRRLLSNTFKHKI